LSTIIEETKKCNISICDLRDATKDIQESDLFFYGCASPDLEEVLTLQKMLKQKYPKSKHIVGGAHATLFPQDFAHFDSVVINRGERAVVQLIDDVQAGSLKWNYNVPVDYRREYYPYPKRSFLSEDKIVTSLFKSEKIKSTTVLFSHGCPFDCGFCANYNRGAIARRSNQDISDEIDYLKSEYGIDGISLQDEICIPFKEQEAIDFLMMIKSKNILWRGQLRAGVKENLIALAKESGCVELSIGMESVVQKVIDIAHKNIKVSDVVKSLADCRKYGVFSRLYLLNGLPGEPKNVVELTKQFIEQNNPDVVLLSSLQPYPGSPIYNNPERYGITLMMEKFELNHLRNRFKTDSTLEETVPFEYSNPGPFGETLSRQEIYDNLLELQKFLRERHMVK
jgi:radical SAM superfamily enzyme YgiQ (UPF0313 family)